MSYFLFRGAGRAGSCHIFFSRGLAGLGRVIIYFSRMAEVRDIIESDPERLKSPEKASPNYQFPTGFITFSAMAIPHAPKLYRTIAFLIILGAILQKKLQNEQNSSGFIS